MNKSKKSLIRHNILWMIVYGILAIFMTLITIGSVKKEQNFYALIYFIATIALIGLAINYWQQNKEIKKLPD